MGKIHQITFKRLIPEGNVNSYVGKPILGITSYIKKNMNVPVIYEPFDNQEINKRYQFYHCANTVVGTIVDITDDSVTIEFYDHIFHKFNRNISDCKVKFQLFIRNVSDEVHVVRVASAIICNNKST